ncbi:Rho protein GDP-dissociation inhibitor [Dillenia turbinata]|uniref:Rho protein GDP-dissociation inhibitor n=1 Tax=Dillenia turbinata TaxID=194707 RepID=A0AAN8VUW3_9MAGN
MGLEGNNTEATTSAGHEDDESVEKLSRQVSESSLYGTEEEEFEANLQLGPKVSLKEELEKDKDDESLRRWKEQLLGSVDVDSVEETDEPDVKILSITICSAGRPDLVLPIPEAGDPKGLWFTLKEGSKYNLKITFKVSNNLVSGLRYTNTVWKTGIKVDSTKEMLGTFSPQAGPYVHTLPEDNTPSGILARGSYSAKSKFYDDDNKRYLEINYTFSIQKEWPAT